MKAGWLAAVVLLLAMAVVTGVLSSSSPPPTSPPATSSTTVYSLDPADRRPVVTWLATPAPPFPGPPASVPPCDASQLRVVDVYDEGATGHVADFIEVENSSSQPCSIDGRPLVELRDARGRLVARSGTSGPFIVSGVAAQQPGPLLVPAHSVQARPEHGIGERRLRPDVPFFTLAQGPCPGGVFPEDGALYLVLPGGRGSVSIVELDLPLAFDYRCDESPGAYPPPERPELLVGNYDGEPVAWFADHPGVAVGSKPRPGHAPVPRSATGCGPGCPETSTWGPTAARATPSASATWWIAASSTAAPSRTPSAGDSWWTSAST